MGFAKVVTTLILSCPEIIRGLMISID